MNIKGFKTKNKRKSWLFESKYSNVRKRIKKLVKTAERRAVKLIGKDEE